MKFMGQRNLPWKRVWMAAIGVGRINSFIPNKTTPKCQIKSIDTNIKMV
jgi:hypothetical protein